MSKLKYRTIMAAPFVICALLAHSRVVMADDYRDHLCTTVHSSADPNYVGYANSLLNQLNQSNPGHTDKVAKLAPVVSAIVFDDTASLRTILGQGLDPNTELNFTPVDSYDPRPKPYKMMKSLLDVAAGACSLNVAELLVERGANVNGGGGAMDAVPLVTAAAQGADKLVAYLLAHGAEVDRRYSDISALEVAIDQGHASTVKVLLDHGANPNQKTVKGVSMLGDGSDSAIRQMLIDHGAVLPKASTQGN